ncbi:MAG TPA: PadR family transcriptional regulator [Baekduia sp.]|jgi:DNA-binding PadR family transcriptional regulator
MSLRHAVLGLLAMEPATGYELTRKFDVSLSNAWHASHSQIYPELAKLESEGMVEVVATGARNSRTWALTPVGREELRRWMVDVAPSRATRDESAIRIFIAPRLLEPADARIALQRDLDYAVAHREILEEIDERQRAAGGTAPFAPAVDLGLRVNQVMQEWLRDQLAALPAEPKSRR